LLLLLLLLLLNRSPFPELATVQTSASSATSSHAPAASILARLQALSHTG